MYISVFKQFFIALVFSIWSPLVFAFQLTHPFDLQDYQASLDAIQGELYRLPPGTVDIEVAVDYPATLPPVGVGAGVVDQISVSLDPADFLYVRSLFGGVGASRFVAIASRRDDFLAQLVPVAVSVGTTPAITGLFGPPAAAAGGPSPAVPSALRRGDPGVIDLGPGDYARMLGAADSRHPFTGFELNRDYLLPIRLQRVPAVDGRTFASVSIAFAEALRFVPLRARIHQHMTDHRGPVVLEGPIGQPETETVERVSRAILECSSTPCGLADKRRAVLGTGLLLFFGEPFAGNPPIDLQLRVGFDTAYAGARLTVQQYIASFEHLPGTNQKELVTRWEGRPAGAGGALAGVAPSSLPAAPARRPVTWDLLLHNYRTLSVFVRNRTDSGADTSGYSHLIGVNSADFYE